jgi:hypothetical protein
MIIAVNAPVVDRALPNGVQAYSEAAIVALASHNPNFAADNADSCRLYSEGISSLTLNRPISQKLQNYLPNLTY